MAQDLGLGDLRAGIDAIDDRIAGLLRERMALVREVGERKQAAGLPGSFIRSGREAEVLRRLAGRLHGTFPARSVVQIWRAVIAASLGAEKHFTVYAGTAWGDSAYWLAREYFGGVLPVVARDGDERTIRDVLADSLSVGVLSVRPDDPHGWWLRPREERNGVYVFAALPFMREPEPRYPTTFAFANVVPERTDEDAALCALSYPDSAQTDGFLDRACAALPVPHSVHAQSRKGALVSLHGYFPSGDPALRQWEESLPAGTALRVMGHYALPMEWS
jgi:chorismate mutase/prephenate dehydratase